MTTTAEEGIRRGARGMERLLAQSLRGETVYAAAETLRTSIVETLSQPGRGAPVVRYNPKRIERPSLPGDPPAVGKGKLAGSVVVDRAPDGASVGPTADYAGDLEFGSADGSVLPRPFMHRSLEAARPRMDEAVTASLRRTTAQAGA